MEKYHGANLEVPKLNKKQKDYLSIIANLNNDINQAYDISCEGQIAILMFDPKGWLFDDFVQSINEFLRGLRNEQE
jgi:hypothetical protein